MPAPITLAATSTITIPRPLFFASIPATHSFYNLPVDKRIRCTDAAFDELALHDYRGASVSRIVEAAGPRSSTI